MKANTKNILIILPRQLGDVLLNTPMPRILKKEFPDAKVTWLTHPMARQLLEGNPYLDEILYIPKKIIPNRQGMFIVMWLFRYLIAWLKYIASEFLFLWRVYNRQFDVVIDAMNNPRTVIQTLFTAAPKRISFSTRMVRNWVYTDLIDRELLNYDYLALARLHLLEPLGISYPKEADAADTLIPFVAADKDIVDRYLNEMTSLLGTSDFIILSPTQRRPVRRWPGDYFVALGQKLIAEFNVPMFWIWGPGEKEFVQDLHFKLRNSLLLAGKNPELSQLVPFFTIRQTSYFSGRSRVWIGNSNGLSHMAVAGGARTVQIHGPTRPKSWTHPDTNRHRGVRREVGCVECGLNTCELARRECLVDLEVEQVFGEVAALFKT